MSSDAVRSESTRHHIPRSNPRLTTGDNDSIASHEKNVCLPRIKSTTRHSGQSVAGWFKAFFKVVIGLSTLGTSVTFNYIISDFRGPDILWSKAQVQTYLSISWLLFLLALAFTSLASTLLNFFQGHAVRDWDGENKRRRRVLHCYATATCVVIYGLVIAAFVVLSLVVATYSPVVGWVAVGFTAAFGVGGLSCIIFQGSLRTS